jgi:predicted lipid-binding transport protein (Tim44 family)
MLALFAIAAIFLVRFFLRRGSTQQPALATAGAPMRREQASSPVQVLQPAASSAPTAPAAPAAFTGLQIGAGVRAAALPADFDRAAFERLAKLIFIRMQAANDAADINDLRQFTTPELFADLRLDLQERGPAAQHTDVLEVQAEVVDFAQEDDRQIVSVRYHGQVREGEGAAPEAFDEVWHLVKPADDSRNWAIAGIQQSV